MPCASAIWGEPVRESGFEKGVLLCADLARGEAPAAGELARLLGPATELSLSLALGGEQFELSDIQNLNCIIGSLGSGKIPLAMRPAEALPDAAFLGLDRLADDGAAARARLGADLGLERGHMPTSSRVRPRPRR